MTTVWTYGGTALTSFGRVTMFDDYADMPERRGENQLIPFRHGRVFVPKYFDERQISFAITVVAASATALETAMDTMRQLFAPMTEQTLSCTREDTTVRTTQATVNMSIQPSRKSDKITMVVVTFSLAKPFFRLSTNIADNTTTINANPKAMTVTNPGTVIETEPIITLTGPLQNTVITNSTNGCVLSYTGTIASPRVVTIQTDSNGQFVATDDLGANMINNVDYSGSASLMILNPGNNSLSIADATHTTGTVKVAFKAPFL